MSVVGRVNVKHVVYCEINGKMKPTKLMIVG